MDTKSNATMAGNVAGGVRIPTVIGSPKPMTGQRPNSRPVTPPPLPNQNQVSAVQRTIPERQPEDSLDIMSNNNSQTQDSQRSAPSQADNQQTSEPELNSQQPIKEESQSQRNAIEDIPDQPTDVQSFPVEQSQNATFSNNIEDDSQYLPELPSTKQQKEALRLLLGVAVVSFVMYILTRFVI